PVGPPLDLGSGPEATRLRPVVAVHPGAAPGAAPAAGVPAPDAATGPELVAAPVHEVHPGSAGRSRTGRVLAAVGSVVVITGAVLGIALFANRPATDPGPAAGTEFPGPASTLGQTVPAPTNLFGARQPDGTVVFTWTNPEPQDGDTYLWGVRAATGEPQLDIVEEPTVTVTPPAEGGEVCIEVSVVRADRRASTAPAEGCAA
ncbi:MAG: serine/threonine protein kinase, partial [Cellulomonas sp.]